MGWNNLATAENEIPFSEILVLVTAIEQHKCEGSVEAVSIASDSSHLGVFFQEMLK